VESSPGDNFANRQGSQIQEREEVEASALALEKPGLFSPGKMQDCLESVALMSAMTLLLNI
jgi:hypothetical protein